MKSTSRARENPNKFRNEVGTAKSIDKFYTQSNVLSSKLLNQIKKDQDQGKKFLDTVWADVFTYN